MEAWMTSASKFSMVTSIMSLKIRVDQAASLQKVKWRVPSWRGAGILAL
jgi:hypothetical protein